jgi:chromosome segregation ATPase
MQSLGSGKGFDAMSKLETVTARLNAALDELERRAGSYCAKAAQLFDLQQERETLLRRVVELEEESRSLTSTNEQIEGRLDDAIGEIHAALGH